MALTQVSTNGVKDGSLLNADINASAAIAGSKLNPVSLSSVGIGLSTPNRLLHLHESDSTGSTARFTNTTTGSGENDGLTIGINGSEQAEFWQRENTHMLFATNNSERLRISNGGKISIGLTSANADVDIATTVEDSTGTLSAHGIRLSHVGATDEEVIPITAGFLTQVDRARAGIGFISKQSSSTDGYAGAIGFYTRNTADGNGLLRTDERARIDQGGNLLLGTTTEGFHTYGDDFTIARSAHAGISIRTGNGHKGSIYFSDGTSGVAEYRGGVQYDHADDSLRLSASSANRVRIDSDGLKFGSDTAAANALDDYEEGTWTPVVGSGSTTNIYSPRYTKIGNLCTVSFSAYGFSDDSSVTALYFTGLPFTSDSQGGAGLSVGACFTAKFTVAANIISYVGASTTTIRFYDHGTGDYDAVRHNHINGTDTTHRIFTTITYTTA